MKKSEIFWQTYLNLERELLELSKYVYITDYKLVNAKSSVIVKNCMEHRISHFNNSRISRFGFSGTFFGTFSGTFAIKIINF